MKKILLFLVLSLSAVATWAYDFSAVAPSGQTLYYNIISSTDHTCGVVRNSADQPTGALVIPSSVTYNGTSFSVIELLSVNSYGTFDGASGLTSVTLPNSLITIGNYAFYGCSSLTGIIIPNSVTTMGNFVFEGCSSITSLTIGSSLATLGNFTFTGCTGLTSITVDAANPNFDSRNGCNAIIRTNINGLVFGCRNTVIPNSVTAIMDGAFYGCTALVSITIPNSVTNIGSSAFFGCSGLTSLTIPYSVAYIGNAAFSVCNGLTSITVDAANPDFDSRDNCNAIISTTTNSLVLGCQNTVIPNTVTSIGISAFASCTGLTSLTIPNSVTSIQFEAFYGCTGLTSITIPSSVTSIANGAFFNCNGLTSITSESSVPPQVGSTTFSLVNINIPVYIPCGSQSAYSSSWSRFNNLVEDFLFTLETHCDTAMGHVLVFNQPSCDNPQVGVVAVPNPGCQFEHWSNGATHNPYTFNLTQSMILTAQFSTVTPDTMYVHDTTIVNNYIHDTIIVNNFIHDTTIVNNFIHDTTIVTQWQYDTTYIMLFDTIIRMDTITIEDQTLYYDISVVSGNVNQGLVSGNGHFPEGSEVEIAAIPIEGYAFSQWSDGNTQNPRTVTLTANVTYEALFNPNAQSIVAIEGSGIEISTHKQYITVRGAEGQPIRVFDTLGRQLAIQHNSAESQTFHAPATGAYMIQVGNLPAKKVVILR